MTGIFVRVRTDEGRWDSKELDQLTDSEMDRFIEQKRQESTNDSWNWVRVLAQWIRDNVREPS